ncbi:MAG: glycine cleavage system protein R [Gammaproteobacteria bacterium]|nr:glycine cleavage system protein R [Gammaproteobacteria bacterium]MCW8909344.1 glycine cleavage system protein R [Gammaproteobacteria bacterium]MCW9003819.1 glycine cleavage system protein R [Gammaproteobacteria bacterium]MCW9056985.1 glycine cleavage system protein R [Gammaproteobacteria bacterium]
MNELLVITAVGEDRPGIVDELSHILFDADLNIEDSRMSILGGEFAIILLVSGKAEALAKIQNQENKLGNALRLKLLIKPTQAKQPHKDKIPYSIKVVSMDHPGIVHHLARFMAQHQINIEDLETESYPAPHTGTPMFAVNMSVDIPGELSISKVRDEFIELCDEHNLDAQFSPLEP